jgi:hypothetical protein
VSVLSLVLALSLPAYAVDRDRGDKAGSSKNPIVKIIKTLIQKICGDGVVIPWPTPTP